MRLQPPMSELEEAIDDELSVAVEWDEVQDVLVKHHNKLEHLFLHYAATDYAVAKQKEKTGRKARKGEAAFEKDVSSNPRASVFLPVFAIPVALVHSLHCVHRFFHLMRWQPVRHTFGTLLHCAAVCRIVVAFWAPFRHMLHCCSPRRPPHSKTFRSGSRKPCCPRGVHLEHLQ